MRGIYPEQYIRTNLGDGLVEIKDNGTTFYYQDGVEHVYCAKCDAMVNEGTLDDQDHCQECHNYDRECQECGQMFEDALELDDDGFPMCQDCYDKLQALAKIKPVARIDMVDLARKVAGTERRAV